MIYTISTLRGQSGRLEVTLYKDGNSYYVGLRNNDLGEFTHKSFDYRPDAKKKFFELAELIIDSEKSYEDKKALLK